MEINQIYHGDCNIVMKTFPDNFFHSLVSDPPYALTTTKRWKDSTEFAQNQSDVGKRFSKGFMGKEWDGKLPGVETWEECLRVAKPGAHMLAFGGTRTHHRLMTAIEDAGWELRDTLMWVYGSGFPKSVDINKSLKKCESELAEEWVGWGSALKPAWEPIIMARKPLEGTITDNITKWGTGGINIDACRIKHNEKPKMTKRNGRTTANVWTDNACGFDNTKNTVATADPKGRFPSNVILDEQTTLLLDEQSGNLKSGDNCTRTKTGSFLEHGGLGKAGDLQVTYGDEGGASRFYYCAKASASERNAGLDGKNNHPTVKPINLMRYLCKLITPKNGVILDPMCGSGSTCIAAVLEGFNYVGVEMETEYVDTANKRIEYWAKEYGK